MEIRPVMASALRRFGLWTALLLLAACAQQDNAPRSEPLLHSDRVSPEPIEAARMPPGTFDETLSASEREQARAALARGERDEARRWIGQALEHWPVQPDNWTELAAICAAQKDQSCLGYATFFQDKLSFVQDLPARVAMLGFQNIRTEEPAGGAAKNGTDGGPGSLTPGRSEGYDPATRAMAYRLEAFYNAQDPIAADAARDRRFLDRYPYAPMLGGAAIGAAIWMGAR